jgi:beta-lactamase class A
MRRFVTFVTLLVAILALFPVYTRYKVAAAPVPPGVRLGGLELSNLKDRAEIRQHLEGVYAQTIALRFAATQLPLRPQDVDFRIDVDQMVAEASQYLEGATFIDIAVRQALGLPQQQRNIPVRFTMNVDKLRAWLTAIAAEHNHAPFVARALPAELRWSEGQQPSSDLPAGYIGLYQRDWTWLPGAPGYALDIEGSIPRVIAALTSEQDRSADLALLEAPAPPPTMDDVARAINTYLANFPGFGAVYVHDLQTDEEARVDDEVAFSGMSTLKVFIAVAIMHRLANGVQAGDETAVQLGQWLDYALGESNNHAANQLLSFLGGGDISAGALALTQFVHGLGFVNTYMQSGFDAPALPQIATPGNQRTDWNTNPDSNLQTTPLEMGRIVTAVYECTLDQGLLRERYPAEITPEECRQILFYMTHDQFQELLWGGLPNLQQTWILHKHGFAFESHSDVALVWGPTGPYVLSIFLYRSGWMDWGTSNTAMKGISRLVWNYFAFQQSQRADPPAPPPILSPPPGYVKIADYIPAAAAGGQ